MCSSVLKALTNLDFEGLYDYLSTRILFIPYQTNTIGYYGSIRARVFEKYAPREKRRRGLRPEQLIDPVTSHELGIQENDLWLAAQAVEFNLVLVTNDAMQRLQDTCNELRVENWAT
jgi:tRNA(fMet)-specific endonuclease VapC